MSEEQQAQHQEYDPQRPLPPGLNAGKLLDEVLWDLPSDIANPTYPEEKELDALAPNLKQLIVERMDEHPDPPMCKHIEQHLSNMAHDVIHSLPEEQQERTARRMREENTRRHQCSTW